MEHTANLSASLLALAICLWFAQVPISLVFSNKCQHLLSSRYFSLPCLLLFAAAIAAWNGPSCYFQANPELLRFGNQPILQHVDQLSSIFLALLAIVGLAISIYSPAYLEHMKERINSGFYWAALAVFMLSMTLVIASANAVSFLVFWELMSLSSVALVLSEHKHRRVQQAGFIYLAATRIATALLAGGFLSFYALTHTWNIDQWTLSSPALLPSLLVLLGLCIKAGVWPFHIWLPHAHPAAPSPVSALMSAVMIKIALYAIIRILIAQDLCHFWLGHLMLGLGLISAFWGILFASFEHDIKRVLAFSSVENVGIILMGLGLCVLAKAQGMHLVALFGLTAAIFHCVNHGLFKALLFLAAGSVDMSTQTRDMQHLGGLIQKMPWTAGACFLACTSACAFPPLNGFSSKWLLYQGFLQSAWTSGSIIERFLGLVSVGALALVGGLAVACFSKLFGITFLGRCRSQSVAEHAHEGSKGMVVSQLSLAISCLVLGLASAFCCKELQALTSSLLGYSISSERLFSVPVPAFVLSSFGLAMLVYFLFLRSSRQKKYRSWECGFGELSVRTQASAGSFSQSIAYIFRYLLRSKLEVEIRGRDRRNFPEHIKVESKVQPFLENHIYLPAVRGIVRFSSYLAKLQAGSIHLYLLYVCVTLLALVVIGTRL